MDTGEVSKGRDLVDTSGNPLSLFLYLDGRDDGRVADVIHSVRGEEGQGYDLFRYEISRIPDGLSVERIFRPRGSAGPNSSLAEELGIDPSRVSEETVLEQMITHASSRAAAQKEERALGLTFASEKDVKEITNIIREAQPHEDEQPDIKFLRQERQARRNKGKTEQEGADRAPDIAEAEFIARAMDASMAEVAWMVSTSSPNEVEIAKLEAQAERKARQAKTAYENGVRSLAEVFGEDSKEGMAEQGWRWLTNITKSGAQNDFELGGEGDYLGQLKRKFGSDNVVIKPGFNYFDKPIPGMIGVFVKQSAWEEQQQEAVQ